MGFDYYTFPGLLIAVAVALYCWQEPRIKSLERGRRKLLDQTVETLFAAGDLTSAKAAVLTYLDEAFAKHRDSLMPIRQFLPYRRVVYFIVAATVVATISAFFHKQLDQIFVVANPHISINDVLIALLFGLSVFPAKWIWDEFTYMQRIIALFDKHVPNDG